MGAAASMAVPEQIRFTDLLGLAPLLTQHTPGHTINVTALQLLFKRNRNAEGFVSREQFIELVIQFGESAELRKTILQRTADYVPPEVIIEKVLPPLDEIYRFQDDKRFKDVHFIDFESFRSRGSYPCFTEPTHTNKDGKLQITLTTPACEINYETSFVIFVSHTWSQRTATQVHKLANKSQTELHHLQINKEEHINTHPDTELHEQYKVCLSGLTKFIHTHCKHFDKIYLWMDYSCLDLTPLHIEQTLNNIQLSSIIHLCDCIFTPLVDGDINWEFPSEVEHFYEDYNPAPWNQGPGAYMNRAWCRIEMFFGANVPLLGDLTDEQIADFHAQHVLQFKTEHGLLPKEEDEVVEEEVAPVAAVIPLHMQQEETPPELVYVHTAPHKTQYYSRRSRMSQRLLTRALSEQRPHVIYSSYEYRLGLPPMIMSPLSKLYIEKYAPLTGQCSRSDDMSIYKPSESSGNIMNHGGNGNGNGNIGHGIGGVNSGNNASFSNIGNKGAYDSHNSSNNTLSSYNTTTPSTSPHPSLSTQNHYKSSVNLDKNYSRAVITDPSHPYYVNNNSNNTNNNSNSATASPLPQKRSTPAVLIRLNEEVHVLITKGKVGYDGEVNEDGERHGRGIYVYANGEKYVGEWEHGKREGKGHFQHINGDIYQGEFHQDHEYGVCNIRYACGDVYFGELRHHQRHGHGLLDYNGGKEIYEGQFKRNLRHGEGVMKYSNGEVYTGCYEHDMRHGMGVLSDNDKNVLYHGYWLHDNQAPDYTPPEHSGDATEECNNNTASGGVHNVKSSDSLQDMEHEHKHHHRHRHHHHHHHSRSEDSEHSLHNSHHSHSAHSTPHHHRHKHHHSHSHSRSHDTNDNADEHALHTIHNVHTTHDTHNSPGVSRVFSDDTTDGAFHTTTLSSTTDSAAHTTTSTNATTTTTPTDLKERIKQMHLTHSSAKLLSFEEITLEHHNNIKTKPKKKKKVHTPSTVHHSTPSSVRGSSGNNGNNNAGGGTNAAGSVSTTQLHTVVENGTPHNTPHSTYTKNSTHKAMVGSSSTPKVHTPSSTHK